MSDRKKIRKILISSLTQCLLVSQTLIWKNGSIRSFKKLLKTGRIKKTESKSARVKQLTWLVLWTKMLLTDQSSKGETHVNLYLDSPTLTSTTKETQIRLIIWFVRREVDSLSMRLVILISCSIWGDGRHWKALLSMRKDFSTLLREISSILLAFIKDNLSRWRAGHWIKATLGKIIRLVILTMLEAWLIKWTEIKRLCCNGQPVWDQDQIANGLGINPNPKNDHFYQTV